MKTLETIENAQIEFFILIIRIPDDIGLLLGLFKHFERMKSKFI